MQEQVKLLNKEVQFCSQGSESQKFMLVQFIPFPATNRMRSDLLNIFLIFFRNTINSMTKIYGAQFNL